MITVRPSGCLLAHVRPERRIKGMPSTRTLLAPGNEAEWAKINSEHDRQRRAAAQRETVAQRIERGLVLSQLAHDIRAGVRGSDGRRA